MGRQARIKQERREAKSDGTEAAGQAAELRRIATEREVGRGAQRGCLFCRESDGGFTSVEHIFPESLGNKEVILPAGVVCDRCNHQVLSSLDAALCDFGPIAMLRTVYGIESKGGKRPTFKFDNGALASDSPGNVQLQLDSAKWKTDGLPAPPGRRSWSFTGQRHDMTRKRLAMLHRALTKIALECAWLDHGAQRLLSAEFDRERNIVRDGGHHGYIVLAKNGDLEERGITFNYVLARNGDDGTPYMGIAANILGVCLVTDTLKVGPGEEVPKELASVHPF
jgi:hypothetical protein